MREHQPLHADEDPSLPLAIITYHPGFAAGSYEDRDYFELLTPLLFDHCRDRYRLRVFTVNHPGYDLPRDYKVNRFDLEGYSIRHQPVIIDQVLRWLLLRRFAAENDIFLFAYGHSMGGLALARTRLRHLVTAVNGQGRRLHAQKVLSTPAFILRDDTRQSLGQVQALKTLKSALGHAPFYERFTQSLFNSLAPIIYRRDAAKYALNPDCTFIDFRRYNPFVLLQQGLELLKLDLGREHLARLMHGSHLILSSDDRMVDSDATLQAARQANGSGAAVQVHAVNSTHNAERDAPQLIANALRTVMRPYHSNGSLRRRGSRRGRPGQSAFQPAPAD